MNDRTSEPAETAYYTGYPAPEPHRSIDEFCARFGAPHYGCEVVAASGAATTTVTALMNGNAYRPSRRRICHRERRRAGARHC